jgi:enoyl-CoA hydratase/carnithine racemase
MWTQLPAILADWCGDPAVSMVVVRGAGSTFSAGADVAELESILLAGSPGTDLITVATDALAAFPKPTLAVIAGHCVGGGWELAAACDLRLCAKSAKFGVTPARLGVVYPVAGVRRLVGLVGSGAARDLFLRAEILSASRALRLGMVTDVIPDSEVDSEASRWIDVLLSRSQLAIRAVKDILAVHPDIDAQREAQRAWALASVESGELAEGRRAFLAGTRPNFPWALRAAADHDKGA